MAQTLSLLREQPHLMQKVKKLFSLPRKKVKYFINFTRDFSLWNYINNRLQNFSVEEAGGSSLPCKVDIQNVDDIKLAIEKGVEKFGGIDIVINNVSNLNLTPMLETDITKVDVMFETITRAAFVMLVILFLHSLSPLPH